MNLVFCWSHISGYMAACWRELAARPGVSLLIVGFRHATGDNIAFDTSLMRGLKFRLLDEKERASKQLVHSLVAEHKPDALFLGGWSHRPYVHLASSPTLRNVYRILMMDNPRRYDLRQMLARLKIGSFLDRMDCVFVAGERCWQFARYLKIEENRIYRGTYGIDFEAFAQSGALREALEGGWPRQFLFVGRYERVKGLDVLVDAYEQYRAQAQAPWPLHCCGMGPLNKLLKDVPGIVDHGFVQPDVVSQIQLGTGVFVLPSRYDAWGLAIVESCAAGLPIVCTEACGASVENVRSYYNGITVPTEDAPALARALLWMQNHHAELPEMGRRSKEFAAAFSAKIWADRVLAALSPVSSGRPA